ncbi:MAG: DNA-formamidopyrimidine glycosylase family protein [Acidimicrobiia bacterium]
MPELPEIEAYLHALRPRVVGSLLRRIRIQSFSVLKTYDPSIESVTDAGVDGVGRLGKRIVIHLDDGLHIVIHLMVAGRLAWLAPDATIPRRSGLAAFDFTGGTLLLTEAGSKRRASVHVVDDVGLQDLDPGGSEITELSVEEFGERLARERHTLKRTLTDPRLFSGIGGAFADEILWEARISPTQMSTNLDSNEIARLFAATNETLARWTKLRIEEVGDGFPTKVTAFHPDMAVHGRYGEPCPECGAPVQRIVHVGRETNYCAGCQTGGRILADRALSRLLKDDRPKHLDDTS